ncbi:MAG: hypothetical protein R3B84_06380 [Zavarzinella sp.]
MVSVANILCLILPCALQIQYVQFPAPSNSNLIPPAVPPAPSPLVSQVSQLAKLGSVSFEAKDYQKAQEYFQQAKSVGEPLTSIQEQQWGYCRLNAIATCLNAGTCTEMKRQMFLEEISEIRKLQSPGLDKFSAILVNHLQETGEKGSISASKNSFQISLAKDPHSGEYAKALAEEIRAAMYLRWAGSTGTTWDVPCQIFLHENYQAWLEKQQKTATASGYVVVELNAQKIVQRQIHLDANDPKVFEKHLPHFVTQMVVTDLFSEQLPPRWAIIGMASLSEPKTELAGYLQAVPNLLKQRKLYTLEAFLAMDNFPEKNETGTYFAEGVSLVHYLVQQHGAKAFTAFLREAPRRGFSSALKSHYQIETVQELQQEWLRYCLGKK